MLCRRGLNRVPFTAPKPGAWWQGMGCPAMPSCTALLLPDGELPGGGKFGLGERLLVLSADLLVGQAKLSGADQHPDGDAAVADASVTPLGRWAPYGSAGTWQ